MSVRHVVVLAAGKGTRMQSARPKVLHRIGGHPLVAHVLRAAATLNPVSTTVIVGHQAETVEAAVRGLDRPRLRFVRQEPQAGTAHALLQAEGALSGAIGTLVVLSGDAPLIRSATLSRLVEHHESRRAAATVVTAVIERPYGFGRIVRHEGALARIVEEVDASPEQRRIREVNAGIYAFDLAPLFGALHAVPEAEPKHERYLPAVLSGYRRRGLIVETVGAGDAREVRGVNSQAELAELCSVMRQLKNEELMAAGVTIEDPATTYIDRDVEVGPDTVIHPGVKLEGRTVIGARCELRGGVRIADSTLGDDVTVNDCSVVVRSAVADGARIGPFAHVRPESTLGEGARVGAFVEVKKSTLGEGAKANHLSYIGDATLEAGVNVGAGTITCNYDGEAKHPTMVEAGAFIGSGTQLVAPVTVGRGAYVAAGSCITEDVPAGALAVARGRQANKDGWAANRKRSGPGAPSD